MDAIALARAQFGLTIMFHYLFPPLSIGLGLILVVFEGLYLRTKDGAWERLARFWTRIFAVNFAMGVTTGIVMEFQFGTNWARFSRFVGDVFGSALAAEGIFAFFLESGFLAVLVFGWDRVKPPMHFVSTVMVFFGSLFSAIWIVVANSWQQTPAGFALVMHDGQLRAEVTHYWDMIFSPSTLPRLTHVLLGSLIMGAFFVASVSAWHILHPSREKPTRSDLAARALRVALAIGVVTSLSQAVAGHWSACVVGDTQPAKLAAFEGHFHQTANEGAPLWLVAWPDPKAGRVTGIGIPGGLSFLLHGDWNAPVRALDEIPADEQPPVRPPFFAYHLMIGVGMALIVIASLAALFVSPHRLKAGSRGVRAVLYALVFSVVLPVIANEAGWFAAEVGRQPWIVYGLLKTNDAVSRAVPAEQIVVSIVMFVLIYAALLAVWLFVLNAKIQAGPEEETPNPPHETGQGGVLDAATTLAARGGSLSLAKTSKSENGTPLENLALEHHEAKP